MSDAMVGVLSDDDDLQVVGLTLFEGPEDVASGRENPVGGVLLLDKGDKLGKILFSNSAPIRAFH